MRTFTTLALLLFYSLVFAQRDSSKIAGIRKSVEQINRDTVYKKEILYHEQFLEHMTDGGGPLTGYFKNGELVKIVEWVGLSSCINITEYYLQNNKLIFTYTRGKEIQYEDSTATFNSAIQNLTMECRFYFKNGKLIKSILQGATRCSGQPDKSWAKNFLDNYSRYDTLFRKK